MLRPVVCNAVFAVALLSSWVAPAADAWADDPKQVERAVKRLIGAIRYGKDDVAAQQLALDRMAKGLLAQTWDKISEDQRKAFVSRLDGLIRAISFKRGRETFEHLDAVLYEPATVSGNDARCKSTVVVHRNYKKTELPMEWVLEKQDGAWRVWDIVMLGDSTIAGLREDQVEPLIKEGGFGAVIQAMQDKLAKVDAKSR